ncbi:SdpI family protein [Caulobacter segnis]
MNGEISRVDAASGMLALGQFGLAGCHRPVGPDPPAADAFQRRRPRRPLGRPAGDGVDDADPGGDLDGHRRRPLARDAHGPGRAGQGQALFVAQLVLALIALLNASLTWSLFDQPGPRFGMALVSAVVGVVGAVLGKTSPNGLIGVRTPWTSGSRLAWDKANRLAGRLFFWGGLAGMLAAPFAPQPIGFQAVYFGVLAIAAIAVFESWRVWLIDPDRGKGLALSLRPGQVV